ncbi:hypothetical protein AHiyo6_29930, partial [Arthrobacter sp. Hiyo6]
MLERLAGRGPGLKLSDPNPTANSAGYPERNILDHADREGPTPRGRSVPRGYPVSEAPA